MSHDRMIRYFEMQQDRRPRARFFIPLADLYRATGRLEDAAALLEEGLGRCADSLSARVVLARVRRDQGRLAEARDLARDVLDRDPGHREAPRLLSVAAPEPAPTANPDAAHSETAAGESPGFLDTGATGAAPAPLAEPVAALPPPASEPAPEPAAESEPAAPAPAAEPGQAPRFLTQTLAEIYLAQGHRQKALAILRRLLAEHPERDDVAREIATLEAVDAAAVTPPAAEGAGAAAARSAAAETAAAPADPNRARFDAWVDRQQGGPA